MGEGVRLTAVRDVVIVGGGHNGLVCAAYLARRGLDVLVVERRAVPGGAAATEEPWPGYRVSTASYVVSLMPPRLVSELGLRRLGYRVTVLEPDYYVPYPDGSALSLWADPRRTAQEIARFSRADAEAYPRFDAHLSRLAHLVRELLFVIPPGFRVADLPRWAGLARRLRHWSGKDLVAVARLLTASAADFLDEWFEDPRVKGALATQGIIGAWAGPMSPGTAYVLLHHWMGEVEGHEGAWGWVHGGMGALGRVLAEAARAAGAEVRTGQAVRRIAVSNGRATGVELEDGTTVQARVVVSNAHPVTTLRELVGEEHLAPDTVQELRRFRSRSGSVKVNLALAELPRPRSWSGSVPGAPHTGILAISPSVEYLERAWDDAKYGRMSEHPYIEGVFPTVFEPDLAPPGRHIALLFTQFGPYHLVEGSWDTARDAYLGRVLSTLEEYVPNLARGVLHAEVLAPPDLEQRFGLVGGNIFHGEMTLDQLFAFRPLPGWGYRTPIRALYLCGAGTHPGGGVMGVSGRNCARVVWRDVRWGRILGGAPGRPLSGRRGRA